jgi:cystathionine gamma-lyase/cystathionine beta-lyase/cystathionine gamma-lyase/homocysteine desulfhydrase
MKGDTKNRGFSTRAIHAGQAPDAATGAVAVPIYQNVTYVHDALGQHKGYEYARVQNPTREALEANVASIESGTTGHAFASGMAAISTLASLLEAGDHAVISRNVYGGTFRLFHQVLERYDLSFSWVDTSKLDALRAAMTPRTRLLLVETPTNPLMEITDLAAAAEIAHAGDALLAVDNTFMSPYFQRPLELGADVVMHSATKFLGGHSDLLGGILVTSDEKAAEWFAFMQKSAGAVLAPFECFLMLRGIKTLAVRMERHEASGRAIAARLAGHPKVRRVLYPGLPDHPGHELHASQASGFGALITFDLGGYDAAKRLLDRVEVMSLAESLGGVETLISHPASMTHASVPPETRDEIGLTDGMVRISVGLEDLEDLIADLERGLEAV